MRSSLEAIPALPSPQMTVASTEISRDGDIQTIYTLPCLDPRPLPAGKFFLMCNLSPSGRLSAFPLTLSRGQIENSSHPHPHHAHDKDSGNFQVGILSLVFLQGEKLHLNFLNYLFLFFFLPQNLRRDRKVVI